MKKLYVMILGSLGVLAFVTFLILVSFQVALASESGFQDSIWLQDPTFSPEQGTEDTLFEFNVTYFNTVNTGPLPAFEPAESAFPETFKVLNDDMHTRKAVDGADNTHIVWMREVAGGIYEIFYAKIGPFGGLICPPMQISDADGIHSMYPSIAHDSGNNAHLVWVDFRNSVNPYHPNAEIYYSKVSAAGGDLTTPDELISLNDGIGSGYDPSDAAHQGMSGSFPDHRWPIFIEHPDITVDAADNVHIVWSDARHSANPATLQQWEVYYQQQTNAAIPVVLTDDLLISLADGYDSRCPAIAIGPGDNVHIVWQDARHTPTPAPLTFTRGNYNADGWMDGQDAADKFNWHFGSPGNFPPPCEDAADIDDDGSHTLGDGLYLLSFLVGGGTPPVPPFPNCGTDPTPDGLPPGLPSCVAQWEVYYQQQTSAVPPAVTVDDRLISAPPDGFNSTMPDIDVEDTDGYGHIVFMDQRDLDPPPPGQVTHQFDATLNQYYWEIYSVILDPNGGFISNPLIDPRYGPKRQSDMAGGGWYGNYTGPPDGYSMYPRVAVDDEHGSGSTHITWHDDRDGNWEIYYTEVANSCNNPASDARVTNSADRDMYPDIALNPAGQPDITWQYEDLALGRWRIFHALEANAGTWLTLFRSKSAPKEEATFRMYQADPSDTNAADGIQYVVAMNLQAGSYTLSFSARDTAGNEADTGGIPGPAVSVGVKEPFSSGVLPARYSLAQNYPNPFNAITQVKYALPRDCVVRLEVYNIIGQKVATLVQGHQQAGYKVARWDASSLSSGIYFYRLQTSDFVQTRKMVVLK